MAIFIGRYSWDGTRQNNKEPIAWHPGAYDVAIFDRSSDRNERVQQLKPFICIYSATGCGHSISANPEKFARHICDDFGLAFERVIWIEDLRTERDRYDMITFIKTGTLGSRAFYRTEKRKAGLQELKMIKEAFAGVVDSDS